MEKLMTLEEVSDVLQLNLQTIFKYVRQGKLAAIKFGRNYRVSQEQLNEFLETCKTTVGGR